MGSAATKPENGLQRSRTQSSITGQNTAIGHGKGDIFKQVKGEMNAIERSRSKTDIRVHNMLEKSASKSRFLDEIRVRKSRAQSAHSMTFEDEAKINEDVDQWLRMPKLSKDRLRTM